MTRIALASTLLLLSACDSSPDEPFVAVLEDATDIPADPATRDPSTGQVTGTGNFTLFSLRASDSTRTARDERIVVRYDDAERADSATTQWDIGFRGTEVILNGGSSGPGAALGVIVPEPFDEISDALATDAAFRRDGESPAGPVRGPARAVCTGSGNGWYTYVPFPSGQGGYIVPTAGRTLLVRLADGQGYAKVRFDSYYRGNPDPAAITERSEDRFYTFSYVTNPDGSSFEDDVEE